MNKLDISALVHRSPQDLVPTGPLLTTIRKCSRRVPLPGLWYEVSLYNLEGSYLYS